MKFVRRWAVGLLLLLIVAGCILLALKNVLIRAALETRLREATGLETRIGACEIGLLTGVASVRDLRLYNPPEFGGSIFLRVPELHLECDRKALAAGNLRLSLLRLHVSELEIVENPAGGLNLKAIEQMLRARARHVARTELRFEGVDTFDLSLGQIRWRRLRQPEQARVFDLEVRHEVFTNLRSAADFSAALGKLAIKVGLRELRKAFAPVRAVSPASGRR